MKKTNVIFTPEDIHKMFEIEELISVANDKVRKFYGISNILQTVLNELKEQDSIRKESEILCLIEALDTICLDAFETGAEAFLHTETAFTKIEKLYEEKRKICHGEAPEIN